MNLPATIQTTITPEKAQRILQDNGMQVSLEQAKSILEFLVIFAKASQQTNADSRPLHKSIHRRAS